MAGAAKILLHPGAGEARPLDAAIAAKIGAAALPATAVGDPLLAEELFGFKAVLATGAHQAAFRIMLARSTAAAACGGTEFPIRRTFWVLVPSRK